MSFLCLPVRAAKEVPLWKFASVRAPTTLQKHVRCWVKESRNSSNDKWFYTFSREAAWNSPEEKAANGNRNVKFKEERIFWLSATSRRHRFRQVYDISLVNGASRKNDVSVIARMRALNIGGTRWILEWVHDVDDMDPVPLMGMVYRRNISQPSYCVRAISAYDYTIPVLASHAASEAH